MKHGFLWICTCMLSSGWAPDVVLQLFPSCEHWWVLRREFSKTSWEIGNFEIPPLPHLTGIKQQVMLKWGIGFFRFCWCVEVSRREMWAHWHRWELNVLCLACVLLGHHVKDPVLVVGRSGAGPTAPSDRADHMCRCAIQNDEPWNLLQKISCRDMIKYGN